MLAYYLANNLDIRKKIKYLIDTQEVVSYSPNRYRSYAHGHFDVRHITISRITMLASSGYLHLADVLQRRNVDRTRSKSRSPMIVDRLLLKLTTECVSEAITNATHTFQKLNSLTATNFVARAGRDECTGSTGCTCCTTAMKIPSSRSRDHPASWFTPSRVSELVNERI